MTTMSREEQPVPTAAELQAELERQGVLRYHIAPGALPDSYSRLGPRGDYRPHRARIIASKVRPIRNA